MYPLTELAALANHSGKLTLSGVGGVSLARQRGSVAELAAMCQGWGSAVAALHTMPTHSSAPPLAPRPWVLNPRNLMPSMKSAAKGQGFGTVLEAYESTRDLRAAVREVDERWIELHWIHGDLSATNVVVEQRPSLRISFLGLEGAGLGDAAWDLASAADTIAWLSPRWQVQSQPLVEYFLLGYRRAGGPGRLYPAMQAVRALTTAFRLADLPPGSTAPEHIRAELAVWLERAQAYAERVGRLMAVA
jgi:aminoglycoside phosphotransferase (APT) family kinase protein